MTKYGQKIQQSRKEKGLSLRQLGKRLKVSAMFLSDIENGKRMPKPPLDKQIARELDIDFQELHLLDSRNTIQVGEIIERLEEMKISTKFASSISYDVGYGRAAWTANKRIDNLIDDLKSDNE